MHIQCYSYTSKVIALINNKNSEICTLSAYSCKSNREVATTRTILFTESCGQSIRSGIYTRRACRPAARSSFSIVCRIAHAHVAGHVSPTGQLVKGVAGCAHTATPFGVSRFDGTYTQPCTCSRWAWAGFRRCMRFLFHHTNPRCKAFCQSEL